MPLSCTSNDGENEENLFTVRPKALQAENWPDNIQINTYSTNSTLCYNQKELTSLIKSDLLFIRN